ncbi:uncharacterized protein LY89DRAFT_299450 [Mollisia scopiformis]|uniref:Uncharacterized protein n=1 Tax=Mollisia scopiformis TaxID=149040 RepID=A0A194XQI1_MOLSC|nr:uncharacterized protein LY89DRAFT_299450 [Mollisia scopiformis]KUJ22453.1 hypothetical protein LY89DRAFT_299450 [Mollisia scopiformis]
MTEIKYAIVILSGNPNWIPWKEVTKTTAIEVDVWKYMDPDVNEPTMVPILAEPIKPTPSTIKNDIIITPASTRTATPGTAHSIPTTTPAVTRPAKFSDLDQDEREELRSLREEYAYKMKKYDRQVEALRAMEAHIQNTIDPKLLIYTYNCPNAWKMMHNLKMECAPTDYSRKKTILGKWGKLKSTAKSSTDLEHWLREWHTIYDEGIELKVPELVDTDRACHDFLTAIYPIAPSFSDSKELEMLDDKQPWSFKQLVRQYSQWRRNTSDRPRTTVKNLAYIAKKQDKPQRSNSPASFNGKERADYTQLPCLCGETQSYSDCPYIIPSKRSSTWKADPEIQKQVDDKVENGSFRLKRRIQFLRDQAEQRIKDKAKSDKKTPDKSSTSAKPAVQVAKGDMYVVKTEFQLTLSRAFLARETLR